MKTKTQPEPKIGRKIKLTPGLIENFVKKLKIGSYAKYVAMSEGITERTYYLWLERGAKAEKLWEMGRKVPEEEVLFFQFFQSIRQAEAESQVLLTSMVFSQAKDDWKAAMELMARKWPEQWAKKEYMDFKGTIDSPDKRQEALNEFDEMFKDVPRGKLSEIIRETTRKLHDAKNGHSSPTNTKPEQTTTPRSSTKV